MLAAAVGFGPTTLVLTGRGTTVVLRRSELSATLDAPHSHIIPLGIAALPAPTAVVVHPPSTMPRRPPLLASRLSLVTGWTEQLALNHFRPEPLIAESGGIADVSELRGRINVIEL